MSPLGRKSRALSSSLFLALCCSSGSRHFSQVRANPVDNVCDIMSEQGDIKTAASEAQAAAGTAVGHVEAAAPAVIDGFESRPTDVVVLSREQGEGVGARVRRSIGNMTLRNFDPFLMLDEFKVGRPAGFPDHPHRGFETVSFMFPWSPGAFEHEDFVGHRGRLSGGDLQWMTAGKGIMHAEMPSSRDEAHGLQLWINLASKDKMVEPSYQEMKHSEIPQVEEGGVKASVIAGVALGIESPIQTRTPVHYLYFEMEPNSRLDQPVPAGWNTFAYTIQGKARFGVNQRKVDTHHTITFPSVEGSDGVTVVTGSAPCKFVLISGKPINEPIVQHGPFVMNTAQEIRQSFMDFQLGRNGFEKAANWSSEIGSRR